MQNKLNQKWKHHKFYAYTDKTVAEILDELAKCGNDFVLDKKLAKKQGDHILDDWIYDDIIRFTGNEGGFYRLTQVEKDFYIERKEHYQNIKEGLTDKEIAKKKTIKELSDKLLYLMSFNQMADDDRKKCLSDILANYEIVKVN